MARIRKVLVPMQETPATNAIDFASAIALGAGAELVLLRVVLPPHSDIRREELIDDARGDLEQAQEHVAASVRGELREANNLSEGVLAAVADEQPDIVVLSWQDGAASSNFVSEEVDEDALRALGVPILKVPLASSEVRDAYGSSAQTGPGVGGGMGTQAAPGKELNSSEQT